MKLTTQSPYEPELAQIIDAAVAQISAELQRRLPLSGARVISWMKQLAGNGEPAAYYHHPRGSPMFLFPWYLEKKLRAVLDLSLQYDLVCSTVNGYYWVRLIDNLTDGQATNELDLLPALGFFHTEFQSAYQKHFQADHSFWDYFVTTWFHSVDVTMKDLQPDDFDRSHFVQVAAQKICAIKIPLAAVCFTYTRPDLLETWASFVDLFGCWHQMSNDLFHWYEDYSLGTPSYFLAEAKRQKLESESIADWVTRVGFSWGLRALDSWKRELVSRAKELGSVELSGYLEYRDALLQQESQEMLESLRLASNLKDLFF